MPAGRGTYGSKRGRPPLSGKSKAQAAAKKRIDKKKVEAKKTAVKKALKSGVTTTGKAVIKSGKALKKVIGQTVGARRDSNKVGLTVRKLQTKLKARKKK